MTKSLSAQAYYLDLCDQIRNAQIMYHVFKEPVVNDMRYDGLIREKVKFLKENPSCHDVVAEARSLREQLASIGNPSKHDYPMLNLRRADNLTGLVNWLKMLPDDATVSASIKITGVELDLIYVEGRLHKAVTRGDGMVGRDVTIAAYCIDGIPDVIREPGRVCIRGQVTSRNLTINKEGQVYIPEKMELISHVAGTLNKISDWQFETDLVFIAHTASIPHDIYTSWSQIDLMLRMSGFGVLKHYIKNAKASIYELGHWEEKLDAVKERIKDGSYLEPFNGLVFKVDQMEHRYDLGYTTRYPEWALAYVPKEGFTNAQIPATQ